MALSEQLDLSSLVTLSTDIELYILEWPVVGEEEEGQTAVLVVQKRGGFLAAMPVGFLPEEILAVGNGPAPPGVVGPSTVRVVPLSVLDNGLLSPIPVRVLRFWLWISSSLWLVSCVCLLPSRLRLLPSIQTSPLEFLNRALCWLKFEIGLCQELSPAQMVTCFILRLSGNRFWNSSWWQSQAHPTVILAQPFTSLSQLP